MLKYNITKAQGGAVLVLSADQLARYVLKDTSGKPVKFSRVGGQAVAILTSAVKVYKKPSGNELHAEYLKHNARSLWLGFTPDFSRLVDNMLEFTEDIAI